MSEESVSVNIHVDDDFPLDNPGSAVELAHSSVHIVKSSNPQRIVRSVSMNPNDALLSGGAGGWSENNYDSEAARANSAADFLSRASVLANEQDLLTTGRAILVGTNLAELQAGNDNNLLTTAGRNTRTKSAALILQRINSMNSKDISAAAAHPSSILTDPKFNVPQTPKANDLITTQHRSTILSTSSGKEEAVDISTAHSSILMWKDLSVRSTSNKGKLLLRNVSGSISGGLWAVMSGSGGGETQSQAFLHVYSMLCF
jgi:hypothetical protein